MSDIALPLDSPLPLVLRAKPSHVYVGAISMVVFGCMALLGGAALAGVVPGVNIADRAAVLSVAGGSFVFAAFALAGLVMILQGLYGALTLDRDQWSIRSWRGERTYSVRDIDSISWAVVGTIPHGTVTLTMHDGRRERIETRMFAEQDCLKLVTGIWRMVPEDRQPGWPLFCQQVVRPRVDRARADQMLAAHQSLELNPDEIIVHRQRYDRLLKWALPLSIAVAGVLIYVTQSANALWLPLAVTGFWWLMRSSIPRHGTVAPRVTLGYARRLRLTGLIAALLTIPLLVLLRWLDAPPWVWLTVAGLWLLPLIGLVVATHWLDWSGWRADMESQSAETADQWRQGALGQLDRADGNAPK
ncbi:MAG: hypothetical protein U0795_25450 [Pirellulales bacterium]